MDVQIPAGFGGVGGTAVYIGGQASVSCMYFKLGLVFIHAFMHNRHTCFADADTEGSFMVGRVLEIAKAAVKHIGLAARRPGECLCRCLRDIYFGGDTYFLYFDHLENSFWFHQ